MGLNFSKPAETQPQAVPATTAANEIEEVKEYDIVADRLQMNEQLVNSPEVASFSGGHQIPAAGKGYFETLRPCPPRQKQQYRQRLCGRLRPSPGRHCLHCGA